ncbi:helix-turn-helix domain-containing protein [Xylella fastidiosa]|uniref:Transcriptional regulator n=1 Tax=Xylella fastidiosa (strain 9a5c) TaxID=160492 RepID=Q9PHK4_XYLFA|nr:helix-turn-helix transcriptional regulator [Xylella fastidiosa]AAF85570.1 transcriptional regulator [Xylella fastidiosa 9a5c]
MPMPHKQKTVNKVKAVEPERLIFGRNFRNARNMAKLSQREIAEKTGLTQNWISMVENGRSTISIDNMAKLAKCVNVPLWKLLIPPL